jgi:hypothetical protein
VSRHWLSLFVAIVAWPSTLSADGGAVLARTLRPGLSVTVFGSPVPLTAGTLDLSALVLDRDGRPQSGCTVDFALLGAGTEPAAHAGHDHSAARATREQAKNQWLHHAYLEASQAGGFTLHTQVECPSDDVMLMTPLELAPSSPRLREHLGVLLFPWLVLALFVARGVGPRDTPAT